MPKVTYKGTETYDCTKAIKGSNYIHLLDNNDIMVVSFDGIVDFSAFTISNGTWTIPASDDECFVAVVREDGTIGKGGHKCSDIPPPDRYKVTLTAAASGWSGSAGAYTKVLNIAAVRASDIIALYAETQSAWAQSYLGVDVTDGIVTLRTTTLPLADCVIYLYIVDSSSTVTLN